MIPNDRGYTREAGDPKGGNLSGGHLALACAASVWPDESTTAAMAIRITHVRKLSNTFTFLEPFSARLVSRRSYASRPSRQSASFRLCVFASCARPAFPKSSACPNQSKGISKGLTGAVGPDVGPATFPALGALEVLP